MAEAAGPRGTGGSTEAAAAAGCRDAAVAAAVEGSSVVGGSGRRGPGRGERAYPGQLWGQLGGTQAAYTARRGDLGIWDTARLRPNGRNMCDLGICGTPRTAYTARMCEFCT